MGVVSLFPLQPQTPAFNGLLLLKAVITSLKSAISRNEAPDLILSQFLASNNINVNEATIVALEELVQCVHVPWYRDDYDDSRLRDDEDSSDEDDDDDFWVRCVRRRFEDSSDEDDDDEDDDDDFFSKLLGTF
jgi:hypothetical protein